MKKKKEKKSMEEQLKTIKEIQTKIENGETVSFKERNILNIYDKRKKGKDRLSKQIASGLTEKEVRFPYIKRKK